MSDPSLATIAFFRSVYASDAAPRTCPLCGVRRLADVGAHIAAEHVRMPGLECARCGFLFWTKEQLDDHVQEMHRVPAAKTRGVTSDDGRNISCGPYFCAICGDSSFTSPPDRDNHLREVHRSRQTIVCTICSLPCQGPGGFDEHVTVVHPTMWHSCSKCHVPSSSWAEEYHATTVVDIESDPTVLTTDLQQLQGNNRDRGEQLASSRAALSGHPVVQQTILGDFQHSHQPFRLGPQQFKHPYARATAHRLADTQGLGKAWGATVVYFRSGRGLKEHIAAVHDDSALRCDVCELMSESTEENRWHRSRAHPTVFPLRCEHCNLRFRYLPNLKRHNVEMHPLEHRNHMQQLHEQRLLHQAQLEEPGHSRSQENESPSLASGWHLRLIRSPDLYSCAKCPRTFGTFGAAARHEEQVHAPKICGVCGASFGDSAWLKFH